MYLRAMLTGSPADAAEALRAARGEGPTHLELLALDELGLIELIRADAPASAAEHGTNPVVDVLGLTGEGTEFAEDCAG